MEPRWLGQGRLLGTLATRLRGPWAHSWAERVRSRAVRRGPWGEEAETGQQREGDCPCTFIRELRKRRQVWSKGASGHPELQEGLGTTGQEAQERRKMLLDWEDERHPGQ